jgi:drug/metabolite transporter (DMT)-like permease
MSSLPARWKSDVSLLVVVLIWGCNFPILKWALSAMHPHVMNIFRFSVSALVLAALYAWSRRAGDGNGAGGFFDPMLTHGRQLVVLGIVGYALYQVCFIVGVNNTTAGSAALIMASAPLWTALWGRISGYEVLQKAAWAGLVLSLLGTACVIAAGSERIAVSAGSLLGNGLMLLAAVMWGGYTAYNKAVVHEISPTAATFFGIVIALPFLTGIGTPYLPAVDWAAVDAWVWTAIVFSGGLSTGIAFVIWNTAVKNVGASNTAVYNNLVPFVALLGGYLFLGETINWLQIAGGALIIGGLVMVRRNKATASAKVSDA